MKKYFELRDNTGSQIGIIENIPEETTLEQIKNRIETDTENEKVILLEEEFEEVDIILDWLSIDYEQSLDIDLIDVSDCLIEANKKGIVDVMVNSALDNMKNNPELSISEIINKSFDQHKTIYGRNMKNINENLSKILAEAKEKDLDAEVVYTALQFLKQNPTIGNTEAIEHGFNSWVK